MIVAFLILSVSFYNLTKNTPQGKSLYRLVELNMPDESRVVLILKKNFLYHIMLLTMLQHIKFLRIILYLV